MTTMLSDPGDYQVWMDTLAADVADGYLDGEEAVTRLIESGHSRRGAESRVDSWLRRPAGRTAGHQAGRNR